MKAKTRLRNTALAVAVAGLIGGGAAAPVQADVLATSILQIQNLQFNDNADGLILDFGADFSALTFTSTTDVSAALTGFPTDSFSGTNPPTSPLDPAPVFAGVLPNPILPNNSYPVLSGPPVGNYAAADSSEFGAPIANVPDPAGGTFVTPAQVEQASYTGLTTSAGLGSSNANQNLNSSFVFSVANPIAVDIEFDITAYLEAYVDDTEVFPGFATAAFTNDFVIDDLTNGVRVFEWAPNGTGANPLFGGVTNSDPFSLNTTLSLNAPLPVTVQLTNSGVPGTALTGSFSATTGLLTPGVLYQLSTRANTNADASRVNVVPEPGILALLGVGLIGIAAVRRRNKRLST